jgi:hypothetical protein
MLSVEEYMRGQKAESEALLQQLESDPEYLKRSSELRDRILARWASHQESETPPSSN